MIKFFISSTFCDMQTERDVIRNYVLPRVQAETQRHGYDFSFTDLRWGINSESLDSAYVMEKILSVCTQEIDGCRPNFIVLLGDRYGTTPTEEELSLFLKNHDSITLEEAKGKSITELEIIYALKNMPNVCLTICIRNSKILEEMDQDTKAYYSDEPKGTACIEQLKEFFRSNYGADVIEYEAKWDNNKKCVCGLEDLASRLYNRIILQLQPILAKAPASIWEEQHNLDNLLVDKQAKYLTERYKEYTSVMNFTKRSCGVLSLIGNAGVGKTCLLAYVTRDLSQKEIPCISLFLGNGYGSYSIENILKGVIYRGKKLLKDDIPDLNTSDLQYLKKLAIETIKNLKEKLSRLVIIVDDLEVLPQELRKDFFTFFPVPTKDCDYHLILSADDYNSLPINALYGYNHTEMELEGIREHSIKAVVSKFLFELGKEIPEKALKKLYETSLFHTPLYISLVIKRLTILSKDDFDKINSLRATQGLNGNDAIATYMAELIESLPKSEMELFLSIIHTISKHTNFSCDKKLLSIMALTNEELRVDDIVTILNADSYDVTTLDLISFISASSGLLKIDTENKVRFCYPLFAKAVKEHLGEWIPRYAHDVLSHLNTMPNEDFVKQRILLQVAMLVNDASSAAKFLIWIEKYSKENVGSELVHATQRRVYDGLHDCLVESHKSFEDCLLFLNAIGEKGAKSSSEDFELLAMQFLFGITGILNKVTLGRNNYQLSILSPIYEHAKIALITEDKRYFRTIYMLAEKCGVSTSSYEEQGQYYSEFLSYCQQYVENADKNHPHLDYLYADLSHAYEKNASHHSRLNWRYALMCYSKAIQVVDVDIPPSNKVLDVLSSLKYCNIQRRYGIILNKYISNLQIGWRNNDELDGLLSCAEKDLLDCETHFDSIIKHYDKKTYTNDLSYYYQLQKETQIALATYYQIYGNEDYNIIYLKKALECAEASYREEGNLYALNHISVLARQIGKSNKLTFAERGVYLHKALKITKELLSKSPDEDATSSINDLRRFIAGDLLWL